MAVQVNPGAGEAAGAGVKRAIDGCCVAARAFDCHCCQRGAA